MRQFEPEQKTGEIACPRCGDPAEWQTLDADGMQQIDVVCAGCGRFSITPEELEQCLDAYDTEEDRTT